MKKGIVRVTATRVTLDAPYLTASTQEELRRQIEPFINQDEIVLEEMEVFAVISSIVLLLEQDKKIGAIKRVRDLSDCSLVDAKHLVDRIEEIGVNKIRALEAKRVASEYGDFEYGDYVPSK